MLGMSFGRVNLKEANKWLGLKNQSLCREKSAVVI
jgi:hypothetical protein